MGLPPVELVVRVAQCIEVVVRAVLFEDRTLHHPNCKHLGLHLYRRGPLVHLAQRMVVARPGRLRLPPLVPLAPRPAHSSDPGPERARRTRRARDPAYVVVDLSGRLIGLDPAPLHVKKLRNAYVEREIVRPCEGGRVEWRRVARPGCKGNDEKVWVNMSALWAMWA